MKIDYNRLMEEQIASLDGARPRLLLHICCAPCGSAVLERVCPFFDVTLYYDNPNIMPEEEYRKREGEIRKLLRLSGREDVPLIEGPYDTGAFFDAARGLEDQPEGGARCEACFRLRLARTAELAREGGFAFFCSTLTVSPHKNAQLINRIGEELARETGVPWLPSDFKKKDGYLRSIRLSREYGLYRQCFCGCPFSRWDLPRE